jgi:hypothetical protein
MRFVLEKFLLKATFLSFFSPFCLSSYFALRFTLPFWCILYFCITILWCLCVCLVRAFDGRFFCRSLHWLFLRAFRLMVAIRVSSPLFRYFYSPGPTAFHCGSFAVVFGGLSSWSIQQRNPTGSNYIFPSKTLCSKDNTLKLPRHVPRAVACLPYHLWK